MEQLATLLGQDDARWVGGAKRSPDAQVIAVLELRETKRKWFVTGVQVSGDQRLLIGFEPRCRYGSSGDGWFVLDAEFFVDAAAVSHDALDVHTMRSHATVAELDVEDRY